MALNQDVNDMDSDLQDLIDYIDGDPGPFSGSKKTTTLAKADAADGKAAEAQTDSNISSLTPAILYTDWSTNAATCAGEIKTYSETAKTELNEYEPNYQTVADNIATVRNGIPVVKSDIIGIE